MQNVLPVIHIVLSILLIASILLQQRGTDLGSSFGGSGSTFTKRRGAEKILFIGTIVLGILFFASTLVSFLIR